VLDYSQTYAGDKLAIEWQTNHPQTGDLRVVLPENTTVASALLDQTPIRMKLEALGDDMQAVLPMAAPTGKHRLELRLSPAGQ
jgi:hypothetical protein